LIFWWNVVVLPPVVLFCELFFLQNYSLFPLVVVCSLLLRTLRKRVELHMRPEEMSRNFTGVIRSGVPYMGW
jgi:hypothetical protein